MKHRFDFHLIDRIKTKTLLAGIKYFCDFGLGIMKRKLFNSDSYHNLEMNNEESIVKNFHILYEKKADQTYYNTYWMGVKSMKCPLDLWIYQEIIFKTKPDFIIETGTNKGGTALFLANICDLLNNGVILTVDFANMDNRPEHKRINYFQGDAAAESTIEKIQQTINSLNSSKDKKVMVILDDEHPEKHVLKEMELYGKMVTKGNYLIVEDTSMGGHPVWPELVGGPMEAVKKYFETHDDFEIDSSLEKFLLTFNPSGYLKKISK